MSKRQKKTEWKKSEKLMLAGLCAVILFCAGYLVFYVWNLKYRESEFEKIRQEAVEQERTEEMAAENEIELETEQILETEESEPFVYCERIYDFEQLREQNEDIYAWITVSGTNIDYPILQSKTDNYYLNHNLDYSSGYPGCIYTNSCSQKDFSDYNTVLYGHNMKNKTMFGSLHEYENEEFFQKYDNIYVYTEEKRFTYQIAAAVKYNDCYIPAFYSVDERNGRDDFLASVKNYLDNSISHWKENMEIGGEDKIITLSTCVKGENDRRYLVIGVLTQEAYYTN